MLVKITCVTDTLYAWSEFDIYRTTASINCLPMGVIVSVSPTNSFASYFRRTQFSFSSRGDCGCGLIDALVMHDSYTAFESLFPMANITLNCDDLGHLKGVIEFVWFAIRR